MTENWRVKMANSLALTFLPRPSLGMLISRPFSDDWVTTICSRRKSWRSSSWLAASRSPEIRRRSFR
jgi:hypothetical protein